MDLDLSVFWGFRRVVSLFSRIPFRRDDKYFASCFHIHILPCYCFFIVYHAWPTLRGRCILGFWYIITCPAIISNLTCYLLTHVYHLISDVLSHDHLTCYSLARPYCYNLTYPDHYQSLDMLAYLLISPLIMLSPDTKHDVLDFVIIMFTGILSCYYGTKCHTTRWGPPLESNSLRAKCHMEQSATPTTVGATSWICGGHLLNLLGYSCYVQLFP